MKRKYLIPFMLLSLLIASGSAYAQSNQPPRPITEPLVKSDELNVPGPATSGPGPDTYGYMWSAETFSWIDASAGTDTGMSGYASGVGPIPLPFSFKFYENTYNEVYISGKGFVTFSDWGDWGYWEHVPDTVRPNNLVAPYWTPVYIPAGAWVRYLSGGTAPNRYFVVEWHDVTGGFDDPIGEDELYRFQVILYENGEIVFQYHTMTYSPEVGTIYCGATGIENFTGLVGLEYQPFCTRLNPNTAVRFYWSLSSVPEAYWTVFSDVPHVYWAYSWINRLYVSGITGGCATNPNLQYCPNNTVTRAQMAIFLLRGIHGSAYMPPAVGGSTGFNDVPISYWAAAWIKQLAAEGITGGCGAGLYCPEATVTRDQMAIFLLRGKYGSAYTPPAVGTSTGFSDVPITHWAAAWIKQLAAEGITGGCGSGNYCPENPVTRAEMAIFLVRTFNLP